MLTVFCVDKNCETCVFIFLYNLIWLNFLHVPADAVSNTPKRSAGYYTGPTAPIPQKATLARSASRSRNKDVSPREEIIDLDFDDGNPLGSPDSDDGIGAAVSGYVIYPLLFPPPPSVFIPFYTLFQSLVIPLPYIYVLFISL